jgi:hypothetical protein
VAKLIITRTSEFNNLTREFRIFLNGKEIGTISSGDTEEFDIPEGNHNLCAKIDWCGSENFPITLRNDETKSITISGFKFGGILMIITPFTLIFLILFRDFIKSHFFLKLPALVAAMFVVLTLTYYMTIGRKKYLVIKENVNEKE